MIQPAPDDTFRRNLSRFRLSRRESERLDRDFQLALSECDLHGAEKLRGRLTSFRGEPGVYFWILRAWGDRFKLYVGQTTSLSYRLSNYSSPFQPNATNDFKLRISYAFFLESIEGATFDLHFAPVDIANRSRVDARSELRRVEASTIETFSPVLLNQRGAVPPEAKRALEEAYTSFYRASLKSILERDE
jgi:hypothetical protein